MQSYAINKVKVFVTFVPARLFVFSVLASITSFNEEALERGEVLLEHRLQMISISAFQFAWDVR